MISEEVGIKQKVSAEMLGTAKRVEITKEDTTIVDGAGDKEEIEARCNQIRAQSEKPPQIMMGKTSGTTGQTSWWCRRNSRWSDS